MMNIIVAGRRHGKTTKCLEWLKQAKRTSHYPFWDRVLLVADIHRAQELRIGLRKEAEVRGEADSGLYYNLVYSFQEWRNAHLPYGISRIDIAVDDAEFIIAEYFNQSPELITLTGTLLHDRDPMTLKNRSAACDKVCQRFDPCCGEVS